jgi:predicted MFS family arabinose efflux permease
MYATGMEERSSADANEPRLLPPGELWRNREFVTLLVGQVLSAVGSGVSYAALPLIIVTLTGSGAQLGIVGALQTLPMVFGLLIGVLADRWEPRRTMLGCDLGRAVLLGLLAVSLLVQGPTMAVLFAIVAPISLLTLLFQSSYVSSLPALVGGAQLGAANSYFEAASTLGFVAGPALMGLVTARYGLAAAVIIDLASYVASGLALLLIRRKLRSGAQAPARGSMRQEAREGLGFVRGNRTLRVLLVFWGLMGLLTAPLVPATTFYLNVELGRETSFYGLILSLSSVGYLLGFVISARATTSPRVGSIMLIAGAIRGAANLLFPLFGASGWIIAMVMMAGCADAFVVSLATTLRMSVTPEALQARVGSTVNVIELACHAVGALAGGFLIASTSGAATIAVVGSVQLLCSGVFAFSAAIRRPAAPPPVAEAAS